VRTDDSAFTALDLLAVLATALILAGLFIPAFAGTRMDIRNLQCTMRE
jgi:competence protein ComGC